MKVLLEQNSFFYKVDCGLIAPVQKPWLLEALCLAGCYICSEQFLSVRESERSSLSPPPDDDDDALCWGASALGLSLDSGSARYVHHS